MLQISARSVVPSPVGRLAISATAAGISSIDFLSPSDSILEFSDSGPADQHLRQATDELASYFAGSLTDFSCPVDISGTEFQRAVWGQIAKIRFGQTLSYGQIAATISRPKASRAVGAAVGANPIPIVIGCHRVMGSDGRLTGYSGGLGLKTKIQLLELEGISYR